MKIRNRHGRRSSPPVRYKRSSFRFADSTWNYSCNRLKFGVLRNLSTTCRFEVEKTDVKFSRNPRHTCALSERTSQRDRRRRLRRLLSLLHNMTFCRYRYFARVSRLTASFWPGYSLQSAVGGDLRVTR